MNFIHSFSDEIIKLAQEKQKKSLWQRIKGIFSFKARTTKSPPLGFDISKGKLRASKVPPLGFKIESKQK